MDLIAFLQRRLRKVGLEVRKYSPASSFTASLSALCCDAGIDLVLDVGASVGQFAGDLRAAGFRGEIVSFEPLPDAWHALDRAAGRDARWKVHPRCALGALAGDVEINVAANGVSSSVLPMLESHLAAAPESTYRGSVSAVMHRVDDVAGPYLRQARSPMLKIDTQGYEWQVLDGASGSLPAMRAVAVELSLLPLYEGQRLWQDVIERLASEGFDLWSLHPGFADKATGRVLQFDGIFRRP